jgi:hypothetical protein
MARRVSGPGRRSAIRREASDPVGSGLIGTLRGPSPRAWRRRRISSSRGSLSSPVRSRPSLRGTRSGSGRSTMRFTITSGVRGVHRAGSEAGDAVD